MAAALEFIEEHGLPNLTMRKLGAKLGVEAMSLYRYVPGREDLLDEVVEAIVGEMQHDDDVIETLTTVGRTSCNGSPTGCGAWR